MNKYGVSKIVWSSILIVVIVVASFSAAYFGGYLNPQQAKEDDEIYVAFSVYDFRTEWESILLAGMEWYAEDLGWKSISLDAAGSADRQLRDIIRVVDTGVDILVIEPIGPTAIIPAIEYAKQKGVIVTTVAGGLQSDLVDFQVGYGNYESGYKLGAEAAERYLPKDENGEPYGLVFYAAGTSSSLVVGARTKGLQDALNYSGVEIVTYDTEWASTKTQTLTYESIQGYGKPDLIIICTGDAVIGAVEALKRANLYVPRGEEGHIAIIGWDSSRMLLAAIKAGEADMGIDQSTQFFGPIAMHYAKRILEVGKDAALPALGPLTSADVNIDAEGGDHLGVNPWEYPAWEPGKIVKDYGHIRLETSGLLFDYTNVDNPALWGNLRIKQLGA